MKEFDAATAKDDKDYLRALHGRAKQLQPGVPGKRVRAAFVKHRAMFAIGNEIDPNKIRPVLKLASQDTEWGEIFGVVRALWSMPYNKGYGRRLRFVVFDAHHEAVIGIIGLQSPPADLQCRDMLFQYPKQRKLELVNSTMDAYAVGAIPPYSYLLGGKLVAGLIATDAVREAYWTQYAGKKTEMENKLIRQPLVAVTTTSAFGRSSMYNRLKYKNRLLAEPIGSTLGFGTLHLEHLYDGIRAYLEMTGEYNNGGFGTGPKVRWQNIVTALNRLGLGSDMLRHGVQREVFLYRLVEDLESGMSGGEPGNPERLSVQDYSEFWIERWAVPRAQRFPHWSNGDERILIEQTLAAIS
ncbi:Druantia anti-phage system protein DruA [Caenimonas koreensis]|uniref:Druantia anti-phage system protein DruA n=1 Tax=Caenimonas koreensis TaxID=367474 RepID=UPI002B277564|nr:Druantia anti-phage system protein DruA [Caenimonas koreensis]